MTGSQASSRGAGRVAAGAPAGREERTGFVLRGVEAREPPRCGGRAWSAPVPSNSMGIAGSMTGARPHVVRYDGRPRLSTEDRRRSARTRCGFEPPRRGRRHLPAASAIAVPFRPSHVVLAEPAHPCRLERTRRSMARPAGPGATTLSAALLSMRGDNLAAMLRRLQTPTPRPTRKADMAAVIERHLSGASLRKLWDGLDRARPCSSNARMRKSPPGLRTARRPPASAWRPANAVSPSR